MLCTCHSIAFALFFKLLFFAFLPEQKRSSICVLHTAITEILRIAVSESYNAFNEYPLRLICISRLMFYLFFILIDVFLSFSKLLE